MALAGLMKSWHRRADSWAASSAALTSSPADPPPSGSGWTAQAEPSDEGEGDSLMDRLATQLRIGRNPGVIGPLWEA